MTVSTRAALVEALKPCPCCGSTAELEGRDGYPPSYCVICTKCGLRSPWRVIDDKAVAVWNARAALAAETEPQPVADGWQDISTAPRDGTTILGYGQWAGEINGISPVSTTCIIEWGGGHTDYAGFEWRCSDTDVYAAWLKPTHWRPLPAAPSQEGGR